MKRKMTLEVRQLWSVFEELFTAQANRYTNEKPDARACLKMLHDLITVLRGYGDSLDELIEHQRADARHNRVPTTPRLRIHCCKEYDRG